MITPPRDKRRFIRHIWGSATLGASDADTFKNEFTCIDCGKRKIIEWNTKTNKRRTRYLPPLRPSKPKHAHRWRQFYQSVKAGVSTAISRCADCHAQKTVIHNIYADTLTTDYQPAHAAS